MKWIGWIMKHLCFSKIIAFLLFFSVSLHASLESKSAVIYYGENISYPMVGVHNYIIVEPKNINKYAHGFSVYKEKMYARVDLCKEKTVLESEIEYIANNNFNNIYYDTSSTTCKTKDLHEKLHYFHNKYSNFKTIVNAKINLSDDILEMLEAVIVDETMQISKNILKKIKRDNVDIIYVKFTSPANLDSMQNSIIEIEKQGMIPYITNRAFDIYGLSSKKAIKREILTLIDESKNDRMLLSAHQHGAVVFEYLGYIQKLYDIRNGLPNPDRLQQYAGVVIWLSVNYESPSKLIKWVLELHKRGIKAVFVNNFGANINSFQLSQLGIDVYDGDNNAKKRVIQKDPMIAYEIEPSLSDESLFLQPKNSKALLTYVDQYNLHCVPAAITPWGAYAMSEAFMLELNDENIWIINPFKFFVEALRLKKLLVPDTTTENGNRLLFTHIDGDGIMNYVESNPELFSGDMILEKILKKYKIPHSVSIIGSEVASNGLFPKLSKKLIKLVKKIYALDNVEAATHTFTHPFIWNKIINGTLVEEYRLKPKGYTFSLYDELDGSLDYINRKFLPKRKAKTVFWSGDCSPREDILKYVYEHNILNINGGYTVVSNASPWLTNVSPLGLERGDYYQVYTGAQNENVYTNDWLGPFWGFKKVVQTFKLTNSPKRLKPIDVYYHLYSGSKTASINALKYIFDWAIKQEVMPIYTSAYIPKVLDYFTLSMANEGDKWLFDGMVNLKTLRDENESSRVDLNKSKTVLGVKQFENHTYIALDTKNEHIIDMQGNKNQVGSYLIASNAKVAEYRNGINTKSYVFDGNVDLKLEFHVEDNCEVKSQVKFTKKIKSAKNVILYFNNNKKARVDVLCR